MKLSASLVVLATLGACASPPPAAHAEQQVAEQQVGEQQVEREVAITGGYAGADKTDARTKEVEDFAVAEIYKRDPTRALVERVEVKVQVVAGLNYAFDITMTGGSRFKIVVYRDLQNMMKVTSYEKVG